MSSRVLRNLSRMKVLVVDDLVDARRYAMTLLKASGFKNVLEAASGEDALRLLGSDQGIDLVLLDILMPNMDGREVLHFIKSRAELKAIPVIMMTGLNDVDSVIECIECGAEDYLIKPLDEAALQKHVRSGLLTKRVRNIARPKRGTRSDAAMKEGQPPSGGC